MFCVGQARSYISGTIVRGDCYEVDVDEGQGYNSGGGVSGA